MDPWVSLIVAALLIEVPVALVAAAYIVKVQHPLRGQARFLDRLVRRDVRVALAGGVIGFIVAYNLLRFAFPSLDMPPIEPPLSSVTVGIALMVLLFGPIDDAIAIWRERRS